MLKVYEYSKCSTCVKALRFLDQNKVKYEKIPIVEKAPSKKELQEMLKHLKSTGGSIKNLFNTSGLVYKEMNLSQKLPTMTETEALDLLSSNGKLVKRPFVIGNGAHLVGFREEVWESVLR